MNIKNEKCLVCNKETQNGKQFCSKICRSSEDGKRIIYDKKKTTWLITIGSDNPQKVKSIREQTKQTNLDTCGHTCTLHSPEGIKKKKTTWKKKYGENIENPMQAESVKEKYENTCEIHLGVRNPRKSSMVNAKIEKTCEERYDGHKSPLGSPKIRKKISEFWKNNPDKFKAKIEKTKETCRAIYGGSSPMSSLEVQTKIEKTCREKMNGAKCAFVYEPIKEQIAQKNLKHLGFKNPFDSPKIKEQIAQTNLINLGSRNPFGSKIIQDQISEFWKNNPDKFKTKMEKMSETKFIKYFTDHLLKYKIVKPLFKIEEYKGNKYVYRWKCFDCNSEFSSKIIPRCLICHPILSGTSKSEQELQKWLKSYLEIKCNKRFFEGFRKYKYELDIYISEKNLGIEFDGLYYHSEFSGCKDPDYHLDKSNYFLKKDIQVIHVWDSEWNYKQEIVKSLILRELDLIQNKIDSNDCILKEISLEDSNKFLDENHIQGICESNKQLGLFYNQELVSVMTLKDHEILRHGDKLNLKVIGSFERFLKEISGSVTMKIDRRFSNGNFLLEYGFELVDINYPKSFFTNYDLFSSKILDFKMKSYNVSNSDLENILNNKLDRIWDCGQLILSRK